MTPKEYSEKALETVSLNFHVPQRDFIHGVIGLTSEVGELADLLKKDFFHFNYTVTRDRVIDEVGDCLWYINLLLASQDATMEEAMEKNIAKLKLRRERGWVKDKEAEAEAQFKLGRH